MGLDYSFVVVTSTHRVDGFLGALAEHLEADDRARLLAAMPWSAAVDRTSLSRAGHPVRDRRGIANLKKLSSERGLNYCFTFCFPPDDDLVAFRWPRTLLRPRSPPSVPLGCIWCSLLAGEQLAVFTATAATSDMSRVLERSGSARALWHDIARRAGTSALFWDVEDAQRWTLVFPHGGEVPKPDEARYRVEDGFHLDVDGYFGKALEEAGLIPS